MGFLCKLVLASFVVFSAWVGHGIYQALQPAPVPNLPHNQWWGPGQPQKVDNALKPFKINVSDKVLANLKTRLESVPEFTAPLEGINFEYGFNTNTLKKVIEFWKTQYNWRERETFLNQYPQFKTNIQGLDIHFIHIKPKADKGTKVLPLLLLHGWPGSIREFYRIIPKLTTKRPGYDFVFELIIPSLPGYGFSQGSSKLGLGAAQMAIVCRNLMQRLNFKKYYVQGGDWGAIIGRDIGTFFPDEVLGHHSNMCFVNSIVSNIKSFLGSFAPSLYIAKEHESKVFPLGVHFSEIMLEMGYMHLQSTKPDTVGVALTDSPVGLAAYILEKFSTWTKPEWRSALDGGLTNKYKYEDLLDNIMIYYITGSITTSMRLYAETMSKAQLALKLDSVPLHVPAACAKFPHELAYQTDCQLKEKYPHLVQSTDMPRGGHFAAFEEPELLAADIFSATVKFQEFNKNKNVEKSKTEM